MDRNGTTFASETNQPKKGEPIMKRYIIALICTLGFALNSANAMDYETARRQAYYLTDKMAYELNLNSAQYDDIYEINLDYFLQLRTAADVDAIYLRYRNEDIRYILHEWQWAAFHTIDYFFRPVRWLSGAWYYPVYRHYAPSYYYYSRPTIYVHYRGGHARPHMHGGHSYYHNRRPQWNGGMRGDRNHRVTPPGRGNDHHIDRNPGRGNNRPQPNAGGRRPGNHNNVVPNTPSRRGNDLPDRRGNDMRSSSRTTVTGGRTPSRGNSTPTRNIGTPTRNVSTPTRSISTPSRGASNPGRSHSISTGSRSGSSRSGSAAGSGRSSRR